MSQARKPPRNQPPRDRIGSLSEELLAALRLELAEERARKSSLESRGLTLSAGAATATALLFGLGTNYSGRWQPVFFSLLLAGGLAFFSAAFLGWRAARTFDYGEIDPRFFDDIFAGKEEMTPEELREYLAEGALDVLKRARSLDDHKEKSFRRGYSALAVGALAVVAELALVFADRVF